MTFAAVIWDADEPCSVKTAYAPESSFDNVTSEYDSTFVFLISRFQLRILKMTEIHQRRKMNFSAISPCFVDHLFLASDFRQLPCRNFHQFFHSFTTAAFNDLGDVCVLLLLALVSCCRLHQQHKHSLSCVVSPLLVIGILQGIAAGIGTSNFLRAAFIDVPNCNGSVNLFLLQQCDLRDTCAAHLPILFS